MTNRSAFPLVSVVIPTYNRASYLKAAVESVQRQTYKNLEIIIVDDASDEETASYISTIRDERIKYFRNCINKGGAASRNLGIREAEGEYIAFLDDDDEWLPEKIVKQVEVLENNRNIVVVYTGFLIKDSKKRDYLGRSKQMKEGNIYDDLLAENCVGTTSTVLIRMKELKNSCMFDERMPSCQDWDLWLSLSSMYEFAHIPEPLVIYSLHNKRISTDSTATLRGRELLLEKYESDIGQDNKVLAKHHLRIGISNCQTGNRRKGRRYILSSLKENPFSLEGIATLCASFLPGRAIAFLVDRRRRQICAQKV